MVSVKTVFFISILSVLSVGVCVLTFCEAFEQSLRQICHGKNSFHLNSVYGSVT